LYKALIEKCKNEGLDFSKVTTFNLDEYIGLPRSHEQSYHYFMHESLFKHINLDSRHTHVPDGMARDIEAQCEWYEQRIVEVGGIDLQILGIGANGHLAFNEPGSSLGSRTRIKTLSDRTVRDNARFFASMEQVPRYAITMGIGTIMEARELLILASGESKADGIDLPDAPARLHHHRRGGALEADAGADRGSHGARVRGARLPVAPPRRAERDLRRAARARSRVSIRRRRALLSRSAIDESIQLLTRRFRRA
jgi:hypothetical protein